VENKTLNDWIKKMTDIQELQADVYPSLQVLDPAVWDKSPYKNFEECSELADRYPYLGGDNQKEISQVIKESSEKDLNEILTPTQKEIDTRRGLALLAQTEDRVMSIRRKITQRLQIYQSVRDFAVIEIERRARLNIIKQGGEPLDGFTSRFIFGPAPQPLPRYPGQSNGDNAPLHDRDFLRARVKSGKIVYIDRLSFEIPAVYNQEILAGLKKAKLLEQGVYSYGYDNTPPHRANPKIARFYYDMGFKPLPDVVINYQCHWYDHSWNKGWSLGHTRCMKTHELEPIE
jgi:hypothetical protein